MQSKASGASHPELVRRQVVFLEEVVEVERILPLHNLGGIEQPAGDDQQRGRQIGGAAIGEREAVEHDERPEAERVDHERLLEQLNHLPIPLARAVPEPKERVVVQQVGHDQQQHHLLRRLPRAESDAAALKLEGGPVAPEGRQGDGDHGVAQAQLEAAEVLLPRVVRGAHWGSWRDAWSKANGAMASPPLPLPPLPRGAPSRGAS